MTSIVGLGVTEMGKIYDRTAEDFAGEALSRALDDAGLKKSDVDGLLINRNFSDLNESLQMSFGLEDLTTLAQVSAYGSTAGMMLQYGASAIEAGRSRVVALIFADAPLRRSEGAAAAYGGEMAPALGMGGLDAVHGVFGAAARYAMAARRHMELFGTNQEHFAAVAVAQRKWAAMTPGAQMRGPMTVEDHHNSRWICEPLRLFDCCLVSNGAVCVLLASDDQARDLKQPPIYLRGLAQGSPGDNARAGRDPAIHTGAVASGRAALREAGVSLQDMDVLELYDCFTYTVIVSLEDYGFCAKGEGGDFVLDGKLGPGGSLPTNTGGGQLSGFYMWGFTPLAEGIVQARGQGGERQVDKHDHVLVSGNGGTLNYHSTTILSKHR